MSKIRRLAPGDEPILRMLAIDEADFDLDDGSGRRAPLSAAAASRYLSDPSVLHWVAEENGEVLGQLHCQIVRLPAGEESEVLLYAIGVRRGWRRKGVGKALIEAMETWMTSRQVQGDVWVLADNPEATQFYLACGFREEEDQPVYLTRQATAMASSSVKTPS